jgi:Na+/H+-translocating membrane pyrophosphatase
MDASSHDVTSWSRLIALVFEEKNMVLEIDKLNAVIGRFVGGLGATIHAGMAIESIARVGWFVAIDDVEDQVRLKPGMADP